jgi:TRAP-type mannitol/chloroaromatic compound transport system permease small subunit
MSTPRHTDETGDNAFGISIFAGVLLAMIGGFHILQGLSAVLKDDIYIKGADYTYAINLTTWGWITMLLGAIAVLVGIGILKGQVWASSAGIGFAVLSAISQFALLPQYPFWSMILIAMDILIIWALAQQIRQA